MHLNVLDYHHIQTMKAVVITKFGGPEVLALQEVPTPQPGPGQVLVRVHATALNRADLLQRQGKYPAPQGVVQNIPGLEFAGEVAELGPGATYWEKADRVFGLTPGGGHAEYVVVEEGRLAAIPGGMDWVTAAAIPEVFITAYDALVSQAHMQVGDKVLIHAVGSGVGLAGVQIARAFGAVPYGTSRTPDKIDRAKQYGLEAGCVLDDKLSQLENFARSSTDNHGFNVVLDLVGGLDVAAIVKVLAPKGRIMLVGTTGGGEVTLPLHQLLSRRAHLIGTILRARPVEEIAEVMRAFSQHVVPLFTAGKLRAVIDKAFTISNVQEAHRYQESNQSFGKIVLTIA
jgi:putative PIG3 family NAD(P)H quinone oxidoreductase